MTETPQEWKNRPVILIYKKSDQQKVENYRGISLLCACYKLCSKILNEKLKALADKLLLEYQNGYR
jgi:hypothetical protein